MDHDSHDVSEVSLAPAPAVRPRRPVAFALRLARPGMAVSAMATILVLATPAVAFARALVRFVHAVPGVGRATVHVRALAGGRTVDVGSIAFAQHTQWRSIHAGRFRWTLTGSGAKTLASGTATVGSGSFDIVILLKRSAVRLAIYRARGGKPGSSLVRVIHAAPELGSPELTLDGHKAVTRLSFAHSTPYLSINPGTHQLAAVRPGDSTPLVAGWHMRLLPGVAYSSIVLGSRGQRTRLITLVDRGAPLVRHRAVRTSDERNGRTMVVAPGDSLWTIARAQLGPTADDAAVEHQVVAIWDRNAARIGTGDPNLIFAGQRLSLPAAATED